MYWGVTRQGVTYVEFRLYTYLQRRTDQLYSLCNEFTQYNKRKEKNDKLYIDQGRDGRDPRDDRNRADYYLVTHFS